MTYGDYSSTPTIRQQVALDLANADLTWQWPLDTHDGNMLIYMGMSETLGASFSYYSSPNRWANLIAGGNSSAAVPFAAFQENAKSEPALTNQTFQLNTFGVNGTGWVLEIEGANYATHNVFGPAAIDADATTFSVPYTNLTPNALIVAMVCIANNASSVATVNNGWAQVGAGAIAGSGHYGDSNNGGAFQLFQLAKADPYQDCTFSGTGSAKVLSVQLFEFTFVAPNIVCGFESLYSGTAGADSTERFADSTMPSFYWTGAATTTGAARSGAAGLEIDNGHMSMTAWYGGGDARTLRFYSKWPGSIGAGADYNILAQTHSTTPDGKAWTTGLRYINSTGHVKAFAFNGSTYTYFADIDWSAVSSPTGWHRWDIGWSNDYTSLTDDTINMALQLDGVAQTPVVITPGGKFEDYWAVSLNGVGCFAQGADQLMIANTSATNKFYIDDVFCYMDQTTAEAAYPIGDGHIEVYQLDGMGVNTYWSDFQESDTTAIDANSYQHLTIPSGDGTFLQVTTRDKAAFLEFSFADLAYDNPRSWAVYAQEQRISASGDQGGAVHRAEIHSYDIAAGSFIGSNTPWTQGGGFPVYRPDGNGWTQDDLNGLVVRWGYNADPGDQSSEYSTFDDNATMQLNALSLEVEFSGVVNTEPTAPPTVSVGDGDTGGGVGTTAGGGGGKRQGGYEVKTALQNVKRRKVQIAVLPHMLNDQMLRE